MLDVMLKMCFASASEKPHIWVLIHLLDFIYLPSFISPDETGTKQQISSVTLNIISKTLLALDSLYLSYKKLWSSFSYIGNSISCCNCYSNQLCWTSTTRVQQARKTPMASSEQYARADPYTQTQRTDQIQQHGPQWRPAQPTLAQNQWFEPSGHYLNVPSQRRSVGAYGGSQMHTDRWINEPISRRQDAPPDHDGYEGAVQNQNTGMNSFHETAEFAPNRASQGQY